MPVLLPVAKVRELCDPIASNPWGTIPFTAQDVMDFVRRGELRDTPVEYGGLGYPEPWDWREEAKRVAYFVVHGWSDPIHLDIGVLVLGYAPEWPVLDGNHRLAAAIVRQDETILAAVSGQLDRARELFGVDCEERPPPSPAGNVGQLFDNS